MSQHDTHIEWLPVHSTAEIACVEILARQIWTEHYVAIIGQEQVNYMLARFQSATAIAAQIIEGQEYFLVRRVSTSAPVAAMPWCGYCSVQAEPLTARLFISKLYLLATERRQGLGHTVLRYVMQIARQRGLTTLWLTVNKHNPALHAYLRWGFRNVGPVVKDIGDGFVMDDFQLEMQL